MLAVELSENVGKLGIAVFPEHDSWLPRGRLSALKASTGCYRAEPIAQRRMPGFPVVMVGSTPAPTPQGERLWQNQHEGFAVLGGRGLVSLRRRLRGRTYFRIMAPSGASAQGLPQLR